MQQHETDCFEHFLKIYKHQYDLNQYFRDNYDEDLEYYLGYRQKERYPLAYNISFNKLLPRIHQILSRCMDQLYQPQTHNLCSVRPRRRQDVDRAARVEGLLNFQLETLNDIDCTGGSYLFNFQWMFSAFTWGKGIAKMYWRKEERITPKRIQMPIPQFDRNGQLVGMQLSDMLIQAPQIAYDGPYAEVIHPKLFVPHPNYKNIQKMPAVFCVYRRPMDYVRDMQEKGIFKNVKEMGWSTSSNSSTGVSATGGDAAEAFARSIDIDGGMSLAEIVSDRVSPDVDIIECHGKYIWPEDEVPYEVGSGIKIKGRESETIAHIGNYKTLLSMQKNQYGTRPFFDIGCYLHPELYWDLGIIRLGKDLQEQYNNLGNARFQNAIMLVNQMLKVRQDADIDPAALIWKPFGIIPVEDMGDVEALVTPDVSQTGVFREQEQFMEETIADITGMHKYGMGQTPARQEHVGTMYSLQQIGEARIRMLLMTMDYQGFRPFMKHMMLLNTFHLKPDFETRINTKKGDEFTPLFSGDIHPDYDYTARYTSMEPALGKHMRVQQLMQLAQIWQQDPTLQQYEWKKAILELSDVWEADKLLKSPEQMQQEQQAMMVQQQQAQAMNFQMQGAMMEKQENLAMKRDVVKGLMKQ